MKPITYMYQLDTYIKLKPTPTGSNCLIAFDTQLKTALDCCTLHLKKF